MADDVGVAEADDGDVFDGFQFVGDRVQAGEIGQQISWQKKLKKVRYIGASAFYLIS